jgi:demethylmenaquinone methyltransferase/2-methoxy-6-polyprenyl-1,4-benzoquinol methylase
MAQLNGDEKAHYLQDVFTRIAPRYDLINRLMTGGQDLRWRSEVVHRAGLTLAMMRAGRRPADPFAWSAADALRLPFPASSFDAVVSGFLLRNVADSVAALQEQYRVLKPGGRVVILDTTRPRRNLLSPLIWLHMHVVIPTLGTLLSGQRDAYTYLPESSEAFLTAEGLAGRLAAVGFKRIEYERLMFGTIAIHWAEKP